MNAAFRFAAAGALWLLATKAQAADLPTTEPGAVGLSAEKLARVDACWSHATARSRISRRSENARRTARR